MRPKGLRAGQRFLSEGQQALFPPAIGGLGESCVLPAVGSRGRGSAVNACWWCSRRIFSTLDIIFGGGGYSDRSEKTLTLTLCYCKNQTTKLIQMALFAKLGVWYMQKLRC